MPRTDRALRRCYLKRMVIEGDVELEARRYTEPDIYLLTPREQNKGILPVNPHLRERSRARTLTPPGRRRQPPVIAIPTKPTRRIRWSEDGDTVLTYYPYREEDREEDSTEVLLSPRYINDITDKPAPIHKKPKKKKKKKKKVKDSQNSSEKAAEEERRRQEDLLRREREERAMAEERKKSEREARIREIEQQKRNNQLRITEDKARQERIKTVQEERWRAELQETQKKSKKSTIKRSHSAGTIKQKKTTNKTSSINKEKLQKAITPLHPRWNYVGDPTRKSYNTQQSSYLSDFHF